MLAVLVEGRRADDVQLAARELRLEDVAGVHGAFAASATRADDGVDLVDEHDEFTGLCGDLVEHVRQPFLEVAAVACPGDHRGEVELDDALVAQGVRHIPVDDALGEALDDRGLADTGLTDEHRVVLGAAGQDLDGLLDLVGPADDRVDVPLAGT